MLALSAMYAARDGLTGEEAAAEFRAGKLVRSLVGDVGDVGRKPDMHALADAPCDEVTLDS